MKEGSEAHNEVSRDAMVALLLKVPFGSGGEFSYSVEPLGLREFNLVEAFLLKNGCQLGDLLDERGGGIVREMGGLGVRVIRLMDRMVLLERLLRRWQDGCGLWVRTRTDDCYPQILLSRLGLSSPPVIYGVGNQDLMQEIGVAISGPRHADAETTSFACHTGEAWAKAGVPLVSGFAKGVDHDATMTALVAGGRACGVVTHGLVSIHKDLALSRFMKENRLLLITPFNPEPGFNKGLLMARNLIIYALSHCAVIAGFGENALRFSNERTRTRASGTWQGAKAQLDRNKKSVLGIPGKFSIPVYLRKAVGNGLMDELVREGAMYLRDDMSSSLIRRLVEGRMVTEIRRDSNFEMLKKLHVPACYGVQGALDFGH